MPLRPEDGFLVESRDENAGRLFLKGPMQRGEAPNQNKRIYPMRILQREFVNLEKTVREGRATGELDHPECVIPGTYALTQTGWKPIEEIREGELIATLSSDGSVVNQGVTKKTDASYVGKMVRIFNSKGTVDQTLTPNHRVMLWDRQGRQYYITASEFAALNASGDSHLSHSSMRRAGRWCGVDIDPMTVPGTEISVDPVDYASFLGIWLAEGYADGTRGREKHGHNVVICQKFGTERHGMIEALLQRMAIPYELAFEGRQFRMNLGHAFWQYFHDIGNSHTKRIPIDVKHWSPRLLTVLLEWMLMGDGKNRKGYQKRFDDFQPIVKEYATVSRHLADDVQEVMVKLGYGGTVHTHQPGDRLIEEDRMILGEDSSPIHIVYGHASRNISMDRRFIKTERVDYDGRVYCVTVPNGNWLMRSPTGQVCWTGNSSTVSLEKVSHVVREMLWDGNTWMGRIEILPTPMGKIAETLIDSGITLGISSRGVGSTSTNESGLDIVQDDFTLVCFDLVQEPSTHGAFMTLGESVNRDVRSGMSRADRINRVLNDLRGSR